jgi:hypothetical protein
MQNRKRIAASCMLSVLFLMSPSLLFPQAYPIKVEQALTFESLSLSLNRVLLHAGKGTVVLIECEKGVTGVVLLASGSFTYATKDTESIHDTFTNALLRFNPEDYQSLVVTVGAKTVSPAELMEQTTGILRRSFVRLYHKGNDALIPPAGVLGGVLYTNTMGDIIISEGGERAGVYSLTDRRVLFDGGASAPVPLFQSISKNWMPNVNRQWMDNIWRREGIAASGENYFYFPAPAAGNAYSQRFDPASKYFQSWFGMYVVKNDGHSGYGSAEGQPDARFVLRLLMTDQRAWLKNFAGMENVVVALDELTPISCTKVSVAGLEGWKIAARLLSNADVGDKNPQSGRPEFLLCPSSAWKAYIDSYARIGLDVLLYVILPNAGSKEAYLIYCNGVDFVDNKGMKHRTLPEIQSELEAMVASLKVVKK